METPATALETLFESAESWAKTTLELTRLRTMETVIFVLTTLISRGSVAVMASLFVLLLTVGFALFLGEQLGKNYYGFFIVAAFYGVAALVLQRFLFGWIKKPVHDLIIKQSKQGA